MIWADLLRYAKTAVPLALAAAFTLMAQAALAVVTIPTPGGWSNRVPIQTRERVENWAAQAGGHTSAIITTNATDDYAEVIAVIDMAGAIPPAALGEGPQAQAAQTSALLYDAQALLGIESLPDQMGRVEPDAPGVAAVHARWTLEDEAFFLALVPTGRSHAAIIMAVESGSQILYESAFDELLWQVEGAVAPREPFPRTRWLVTAVICWTMAALLATFVVARIGPQLRPRTIAARAAVVLAGAGIVVGVIVYLAVTGRARELASAGVSPAWLALEVAGFGFGLAVVTLLLGATWDRRSGPVSSAPAGGSFARRRPSSPAHPLQPERVPAPPSPHVDTTPTPIVGTPVLPPALDTPEPTAVRQGARRLRHGTGELPANLELATELVVDTEPRGVPAADAPGRIIVSRDDAHSAPPKLVQPEPGTPAQLATDRDLSGPATLETEQILIDRGSTRGGAQRSFPDDTR